MSLLFDQNLSRHLPRRLADIFPSCQQALLVGLDRFNDLLIWRYASDHRLTIVTFDHDFVDLSLRFGQPPKVIFLITGNVPTATVELLIRDRVAVIRAFVEDPAMPLLCLP